MSRLSLPLLSLIFFVLAGCVGHSTLHAHRDKIYFCQTTPCGAEITYPDMVLNYMIVREPSSEYVLTGTAMPKGISSESKIDLAILSIELVRDTTVFESYSFPMIGNDLSKPLEFRKRFKPSGGFDGVMFNWDIRVAR